MRRTVLFLATACLLALLPACGLKQVSGLEAREQAGEAPPLRAPQGFRAVLGPSTWALERVSRDGTVIWIRSAESDCNTFHHAKVTEVKSGLRVTALDRVLIPKPGYGCRLPLYARPYRVELQRPLGSDKIFGECVPGDETGEQRTCALMHEAAESKRRG